jgi:hypothetical protein
MSLVGFSQNLEDIFVSKKNEMGMLYHLKQVELKACKKSELHTDFTFTSTPEKDSVRLLVLFSHPDIKGKPSSLSIISENLKVNFSPLDINVVFVDKKKKNWHTRVEAYMTEADFKKLLSRGTYQLIWNSKEFSCIGNQPNKYIPLFQEFGTLLEYN